jgi:hypothetical protein
MNAVKPHQSVVVFRNSIIAFGLAFSETTLNIERLDIEQMRWKSDQRMPTSSPTRSTFAAGFSAIQVNEDEVLLFGGKSYEDSLKSNKRTTDKSICPQMFLFNPDSLLLQSAREDWVGNWHAIRRDQPTHRATTSIVAFEFMISRTNPIVQMVRQHPGGEDSQRQGSGMPADHAGELIRIHAIRILTNAMRHQLFQSRIDSSAGLQEGILLALVNNMRAEVLTYHAVPPKVEPCLFLP